MTADGHDHAVTTTAAAAAAAASQPAATTTTSSLPISIPTDNHNHNRNHNGHVDLGNDNDKDSQDGFTLPSQIIEVAGLLFDMDGTIIDSTAAVIRHWTAIGTELNIDPAVILATSHGRRSIDVLAQLDPARANWEYVNSVESQIPQRYGEDAVEIPGARMLLRQLNGQQVPWTIVTSGSRGLVGGWVGVLGLPRPPASAAASLQSSSGKGDESSEIKDDGGGKADGYMSTIVTAEDVEHGKPDPACYRLGKQRLFGRPNNDHKDKPVLVLEDAPAGIQAGYDAGCRVVALATSHSIEQLKDTKAEWLVRDLRSVRLLGVNDETGLYRIEISRGYKR